MPTRVAGSPALLLLSLLGRHAAALERRHRQRLGGHVLSKEHDIATSRGSTDSRMILDVPTHPMGAVTRSRGQTSRKPRNEVAAVAENVGPNPATRQRPPGWEPDYINPSLQRYWDGSEVTATRRWVSGQWVSESAPAPDPSAPRGADPSLRYTRQFGQPSSPLGTAENQRPAATLTAGIAGLFISGVLLIVGLGDGLDHALVRPGQLLGFGHINLALARLRRERLVHALPPESFSSCSPP